MAEKLLPKTLAKFGNTYCITFAILAILLIGTANNPEVALVA